MKPSHVSSGNAPFVLATTAALLLGAPQLQAQYAPPPPPTPFPGFINEAMRKNDPYMNAWNIGGFARARYEVHDGRGIPGILGSLDFRENGPDNLNQYLLERFQVRAAYTGEWFGAFVEGRGSLVQSDQRPAFAGVPLRRADGPESDTIDLHQAYLTLGNHKEFPLSLKLGRQEFSYADERFVGGFIWNNIGRVFDAAKVRWQNAWFAADFFTGQLVVPVDGQFNERNRDETFSGIYATSPKIPKHQLEAYVFSRNVSADAVRAETAPQVPLPSARDIYSVGVRLKSAPGEFGPWDYTLDAQGQFGNFRDARLGGAVGRLDHQAYAIIAQGGYSFADAPAKPRVALEYAVGSGDSDPRDGSHGTFDNLYPTNHKFYGYADFASLQNLHDLRPMLTFKPTPRLSVALEGHLFWLYDTSDNFYTVGGAPRGGTGPTAGRGYGANPTYSSFLGSEIDLIAGYALTRYAQVEAGYCHFFTGDYIDQSLSDAAFGSRDANFFYVQINLTF